MAGLLHDILRPVETLPAGLHGLCVVLQKELRQSEVLHEPAHAEAELHKIPSNSALQQAAVGKLCAVVVDEMDMFTIPQQIAGDAVAVQEAVAMEVAKSSRNAT